VPDAAYTLTYSAGENGTITGNVTQTVSSGGSGTAVTAVANPGYHFAQWNDGNTQSTRTDTNITANLSVSATFVPDAAYTLTYSAGENGTITGNVTQTVSSGRSGTAVTAVANPGYHFAQWSDGNTQPTRTDTNITANLSVTATFAPDLISSDSDDSTTLATTPATTANGVDVLVNGKLENAGIAVTSKRDDQTVTTIVVDQKKLEDKLAAEEKGAVVTIPVAAKSDVYIGELNGLMVKNMEGKQAVVEIKTDKVTYTLPAQQINIDAVSDKIGKSVALQDIKVQIEIAAPTADQVKVVEDAAKKGALTLVVPPVEFTVRATYGEKTIEVSAFNAYVHRTIAIPDGVDPNKITTGVVVESDGTVRHVPTKIVMIDGKYYAIINSLTNSTYSVVWHPLEFSDVANHWAKDAVNDMGSRMVIDGTGDGLFSPDRDITRAEFAAIVVRGLGLKLDHGTTPFSDVKVTDWYSDAVNTAYEYNLITGFEDGTLRPNDNITREQAMVVLAKAMKVTGLKDKLSVQSADAALRPFGDAAAVSKWALSSIADCVQAGIVTGRNGAALAPKANMTRAEVAMIIQKLLQKSDLI
jgi:hypothetical protein